MEKQTRVAYEANKKENAKLNKEQRFLSKIKIKEDTGCWEWQAAKNKSGYGKFSISHSCWSPAHRVSFNIYKGDIADGLYVCHGCDNPSCVNPDHLFLGTQKQNLDDMFNKGRKKSAQCGTMSKFKTGCRCEPCKEAQRENGKQRRIRKKNKKNELLCDTKFSD